MRWQLQQAKQRFSELLRRVEEEGPQIVTRHGEDIAVIVEISEYRHLTGGSTDFKEFLLTAPDLGELEIERSGRPAPRIDLAVHEQPSAL
jgi:prevent-host-death family protein